VAGPFFALRTVRRVPAFSLAVTATIALAIGANTAIFTVVNGILLEPLPFEDSERVIQLCETNGRVRDYCIVSPPNLQDWSRMATTVESFGLARSWTFILDQPEGGRSLQTGVATPGWFTVHGVEAAVGRLFGETIVPDGEPFTVVGVLPPSPWIYRFGSAQIWVPLTAIQDDVTNRGWRGFTGLGKLAEDTTLTAARQEMAGIRASLERDYPDTNRGWGLRLELLRDSLAGSVRGILLLFLGAVGLVLLIACANVASLLLVRSTMRTQEFPYAPRWAPAC
jgi:hypothetical protein